MGAHKFGMGLHFLMLVIYIFFDLVFPHLINTGKLVDNLIVCQFD
jgi:hypothetical protein